MVRDRQRVMGEQHVEAGERPPRASDHVEGPLAPEFGKACFLHGPRHLAGQRAIPLLQQWCDTEDSELQRHAAPYLAVLDVNQLETAATEIADDAVGFGNGGEHALPGHLPFLLARQQLRIETNVTDPGEEVGAVRRIAHRRRGDDAGAGHAHLAGQQKEAFERGQRAVLRLFGQRLARPDALAEAGHDLFVEHDRGDSGRPRIDDEAHGVRPDVDDRNAFLMCSGHRDQGRRRRSLGTAPLLRSAAPRPESDGLVMK